MNFIKLVLVTLSFIVVSPSYAQTNDLEEIYSKIVQTDSRDVKTLLGENAEDGLLMEAMTMVIDKLNTPDLTIVEYESSMKTYCNLIKDITFNRLFKLLHNKELPKEYYGRLVSAKDQYQFLNRIVERWERWTGMKQIRIEFLDKLLETDALGKTGEIRMFFGPLYNFAGKILKDYEKDPTPLSAIRVLAVEAFRRRVELFANNKGAPEYTYRQMEGSEYFDVYSETYKSWKKAINDIKEKDLEPRTPEEKEKLDDYKVKIELLKKLELK